MTKAVIFDMYETLITLFESPFYFGTQMASDAVCLSFDEGLQKPDPAIFNRCLEKLNVQAKYYLYVGDGEARNWKRQKWLV